MNTNKTIIEVLRESQGIRKQIYGDLFDWDLYDQEDGTRMINGYCALGALACEAGLDLDPDEEPSYTSILDEYNVLNDLDSIPCPLQHVKTGDDDPVKPCTQEYTMLINLIPHLNDYHRCTFEEIANILEPLFKENIIKVRPDES